MNPRRGMLSDFTMQRMHCTKQPRIALDVFMAKRAAGKSDKKTAHVTSWTVMPLACQTCWWTFRGSNPGHPD